jgi:uridylate kinase
MDIKYKRILLKVSGESMAGKSGFGIDNAVVSSIVSQLKLVYDLGAEIGVVVGGGNFWRGRQGGSMDRTTADHMGMLATVINALALQDALEKEGLPTRVQTALTITRVAEPYILRKAINHLDKRRIVIFACGTGNPYFSTDTAAALRTVEIRAEVLLLGKNIDGIYDSDPKINKNAKKIDKIKYLDLIAKELKAMDTTAVTICMENKIPIIVFAIDVEKNILKAVTGEKIGTLIYGNV